MKKLKEEINYTKIIKDLGSIVAQGAVNIERAYKTQVIKTHWEVGRYLKEALPLDDKPSANNARIINRLVKEFGRPDNYFYSLIKFYKLYPELPVCEKLTWSHYDVLLRIDDPRSRQRYQRLAVQKNISAKLLCGLIANDKVQKKNNAQNLSLEPVKCIRGLLYHYKVTAPKDAESNAGKVTLDVGFKIYRDIPLSKKSKIHVGHMVRTIKAAEGAAQEFATKIANEHKDCLYTYVAAVERVVDGDTLIVMIDLGLKTKTKQRLRLRGIDAPELTTKRGKYVKDYVKKLIGDQEFIIVKTYKDDKYGRMLADVFYLKNEKVPEVVTEKGIFLNQELVDKGLAKIWS